MLQSPRCIVVLFHSNDLRIRDHYPLTLAVRRAKATQAPLVAAYCFDIRCFAQPSLLCGFYRASPLRAQFLVECVAELRRNLRAHRNELIVRVGKPEEEITRLAAELGPCEIFCSAQYAPHEGFVARAIGNEVKRHDSTMTSVWNTTLFHIDDLPRPPELMIDQFTSFFDDVDMLDLRPTRPFDCTDGRLEPLGLPEAVRHNSVPCGDIPDLATLGYSNLQRYRSIEMPDVPFPGGESAAVERVDQWLSQDAMLAYVGAGRHRPSRRHTDHRHQARVSPWISTGCISPRWFMEKLLQFDFDNATSGITTNQVREAKLRLAKRDFAHFLGLKWGRRLFFPYGPRPEDTEDIPDSRMDRGIIQRWAAGLTGIPFVDAGIREMEATGWSSQAVREASVWTLARGLGQDWRVAAEWLERTCLDYDPFITYYNTAYYSGIIKDRFGPVVKNVYFTAYQADSMGIYVRRWVPEVMRIPSTYIHRPHVISPKMQKMYSSFIGGNYPMPIKLWRGAQREFDVLPSYFAGLARITEPGMFEAERFSTGLLDRSEVHPCVTSQGLAAAAMVAPKPRSEELHLIRSNRAAAVTVPTQRLIEHGSEAR